METQYASILHLSRKIITSMLHQYRFKMNNLFKSKTEGNENYKKKLKTMLDLLQKNLFDISAYKFSDFKLSTCKRENRVYSAERVFFKVYGTYEIVAWRLIDWTKLQ